MHFTGTVYRNPYWPTWPLLEITQGCTHNKCKFCTMYKDVPFKMSPMEWIEEDLREIAGLDPHAKTIQLLSANPLALSYDRLVPIIVIIGLFVLATVLIGGKTGAKSLLGLVFTLVALFYILIPALMKGAPTIFTTFLVAAYITVVALAILGGLQKKTVCAMLGTILGTALAMIFGLLAQNLLRISGMRVPDAEALLQLQQTGTPIGISGLLVAGVIISALGAVMDVAMSIASALTEVHHANPNLTRRDLIRSGMNIGHDMVGTMTNTLILALLGSSMVLIVYLYSLSLSAHQFISSSYLAIEIVSGISSSIGVILAVPLTVLVTSFALTIQKK